MVLKGINANPEKKVAGCFNIPMNGLSGLQKFTVDSFITHLFWPLYFIDLYIMLAEIFYDPFNYF